MSMVIAEYKLSITVSREDWKKLTDDDLSKIIDGEHASCFEDTMYAYKDLIEQEMKEAGLTVKVEVES